MKLVTTKPARSYAKGIGFAVADRTINRKITEAVTPYKKTIKIPRRDDMALDNEVAAHAKSEGLVVESYFVEHGNADVVEIELTVTGRIRTETWADVAERVARGSVTLEPRGALHVQHEYEAMSHHLRQASLLMSGRHLQHGDETQHTRNMEVFTNCATSAASFLTFYLLLNGSGVGRSYDDSMMVVDFKNLPVVVPVCDMNHADVQSGEIQALDLRSAKHLYAERRTHVFEVPDSREGWAKAVEKMELMAFKVELRNDVLLLDFSKVRPRGSPIAGMQDRPASGPGPLISAIRNVATLRDAGMAPWRAAMYADHYLAECVLVGGARRAARMSTKFWKDKNVLDFVQVKRGGFLWSSNNSVTVDAEFWRYVNMEAKDVELTRYDQFYESHAKKVFNAICEAAYYDGTGEPGIINVDKLTWNSEGIGALSDGDFAESERYKLDVATRQLMKTLYGAWLCCDYQTITNPCVPADTPILTRNGYVNIGDVIGQDIEIWNGNQFSKVRPFSTGINKTVIVSLSDGTSLRCTPSHKFVLAGERYSCWEGARVVAQDLRNGDKLAKYDMPIIMEGADYGDKYVAYSQGFYSGDGNTNMTYSWLYATKYVCQERLIGRFGSEHDSCERKTWTHGEMRAKDWVPVDANAIYCLNWLAGLLDSDGTVIHDREGGESFQISSIDKDFLLSVRLMLTRLGVQAKVRQNKDAGVKSMPDGRGGKADYHCKAIWRLLINNYDAWTLKGLGISFSRLDYTGQKPNRSARRFVTVESVEYDEPCETFCFTEPLNHTGTFNGIVTAQCGEILLASVGGYCVIADVVPFHAKDDDDAEDAFRTATRALIRTNTMNALYGKEVSRTNRIGVGITGFHEWAWARFGFGWKEIIDESVSKEMWLTLSRFKRAVQGEALYYSGQLGMVAPHTNTTFKPSGTTSKLFGLTEGAHLPSMREYLRWVQFRNDDPLIDEYRAKGYPVKKLQTYSGTTVVGFPTQPLICSLGMGDKLVTAAEATPEEQYQFLRLLEKYWLTGVKEDGVTPLEERGNQISYTLKFNPEKVNFEDFKRTLREGQATIRCCSVMPQTDATQYEYQPEQPMTKGEYELIRAAIKDSEETKEDVGMEHVDCSTGACPISFNENQ